MPSSGRAKSCTRTASGWPLGRSSRPPFLKSPTSSFFFVSTEIAGWPAVWQAFTCALMYSNWASRSGWLVPSRVLRLACRLKPSRRSSRPTSFWPAAKPRSVSARARWRWLLLTHSKAASGSPATDTTAEVVPPEAQFGQAAADGAPRDTGRRRHCRYAAAACRPRLARREQAPPPFVQERRNRLEACSDARDIDHPSSRDTPGSQITPLPGSEPWLAGSPHSPLALN